MRRDLLGATVAIASLVPGLIFPFVLNLTVGAKSSDTFLLASSVSVMLVSVFSTTVELNTASEIGAILGRDSAPSKSSLRQYKRKVFRLVGAIGVPLFVVLLLLYSARAADPTMFMWVALALLPLPIFATYSATLSGELIAQGRTLFPIFVQSFRSLVPLIAIVTFHDFALPFLAATMTAGELCRLIALTIAVAKHRSRDENVAPLESKGIAWQALSTGTSQFGPATDRVFLAGAGPGFITAYELSNKVFFAAIKALNLGVLLRRISKWSRLRSYDAASYLKMLRRDLTRLVLLTAAASCIGIMLCFGLRNADLFPDVWDRGFTWASILLIGAPFSLFASACSRLIVICRRQSALVWFGGITAVGNAVLDALFFFLIGPVGIPIATVLTRAVSAVVYGFFIGNVVPKVAGTDQQQTSAE